MLSQRLSASSSYCLLSELATPNTQHRNTSTHLQTFLDSPPHTMADVDMTDAPPVTKKKGGDVEAKKRFEVKKVSTATTRS